MRLANRSRNRARTAAGRLGDVLTAKCRIALLLTLLTFCPPGPLLRANDSRSSSSGMTKSGVMTRFIGRTQSLVAEFARIRARSRATLPAIWRLRLPEAADRLVGGVLSP